MDFETGNRLQIPEFGKLQDEYQQAKEKLKNVICKIEEQNERMRLMKEHLAQAQQRTTFNQDFYKGLEKELESDLRLQKLKLEETRWVNLELSRMSKEIKESETRVKKCQQLLLVKHRQMDDLHSALAWESDTCQSWLRTSLDRQDQNLQDLRTQKESASFISKLFCDVQKFQKELTTCTAAKEEAVHNYLMLQGELRRVSDDFSSNNQDHQGLLKLWEQCVQELDAVDKHLDAKSRDLAVSKKQAEEMSKSIGQVREELGEQRKAEAEMLEQIDQFKVASNMLNQQLTLLGDSSELQLLKRQVKTVSCETVSLRAVLHKLRFCLEQKNQTVTSLKKKVSELGSAEIPTTASDEGALLQSLLEREKKTQSSICLERLRSLCNVKQQSLNKLKAKCQTHSTCLQNNQDLSEKKEKQLIQKKELLDRNLTTLQNLEQEVDVQQKRIKRLRGVDSPEPSLRRAVAERLNKLAQKLCEQKARKWTLDSNLSKTQEDIRKSQKDMDNLKIELSALQNTAMNLEQDQDALQRTLVKASQQNKELSVDKSLLQVSVRQLQYILEDVSIGLMDAKEHKRKEEQDVRQKIEAVKEKGKKLQGEINVGESERTKLSLQLARDSQRLKSLKARLAVTASTLPPTIQEDRPASVVNKALELKRHHQKEEAELNETLARQQGELATLQLYLDTLQTANSTTRQQFLVRSSVEEVEQSRLKVQLDSLLAALLEKRRTGQELSASISELESRVTDLQLSKRQSETLLTEAQFQREKLKHTLADQEQKIIRADGVVQKLVEDSHLSGSQMEEKQKYIELCLLRRVHQNMRNIITSVARKEPNFYVKLSPLVYKK